MRFHTGAIGLAGGLLSLALTAGNAAAGIGIFSDAGGSNCNLSLPNLVPATVYALYVAEGGPPATGVAYRITGMPGTLNVTFTATMTPAPGSYLNLGHGFDGSGHSLAWASPQPFDQNGNLLLATYLLFNYGPPWGPTVPAGTIFKVGGRHPPSQFECLWSSHPYITDAQYNITCQLGGEMRVNGGPSCTVAIEARTWTEVRNLYR